MGDKITCADCKYCVPTPSGAMYICDNIKHKNHRGGMVDIFKDTCIYAESKRCNGCFYYDIETDPFGDVTESCSERNHVHGEPLRRCDHYVSTDDFCGNRPKTKDEEESMGKSKDSRVAEIIENVKDIAGDLYSLGYEKGKMEAEPDNEIFVIMLPDTKTYRVVGNLDTKIVHHFQNWAENNGIKVTAMIPANIAFREIDKEK